ncbi:CLUMA_CG016122, isoform A [Clunio marinus]|uniref:CLUMA_CG016122, isoform A n=1 Tax=Clunio marinus TaxID=568069 RepID=A0A1J1IRR6_9DIPT|nr:CLUMA_CG016122, isoform A [Clunio marinus]
MKLAILLSFGGLFGIDFIIMWRKLPPHHSRLHLRPHNANVYVKQAVPVVSVPAVPALSFRANWSYQPWVPTFHTANVAVQASKTKGFAASADAVGVVEHDAKTDDDGFDDAK